MYCLKVTDSSGICACSPKFMPNEDMSACEKAEMSIMPVDFDFKMCKDTKPDVVEEVCPADACAENEECKMKVS